VSVVIRSDWVGCLNIKSSLSPFLFSPFSQAQVHHLHPIYTAQSDRSGKPMSLSGFTDACHFEVPLIYRWEVQASVYRLSIFEKQSYLPTSVVPVLGHYVLRQWILLVTIVGSCRYYLTRIFVDWLTPRTWESAKAPRGIVCQVGCHAFTNMAYEPVWMHGCPGLQRPFPINRINT